MSKATSFSSSNPILGQLFSFIPREIVAECVKIHSSDKWYKQLKTWDHLVFMCYGVLTGSSGMREIIKGFELIGNKLHHIGLSKIPKRSTVSDANTKRNSDVFRDIYLKMYAYYKDLLSDSYLKELINKEIDPKGVDIFDSTTVTLFKDIFKGCGRLPENGRKKGGIKIFTKINLGERIPNLIILDNASTNEKAFLNKIPLQSGNIFVFDKGFQKYSQYEEWSRACVFYVTRLNENATFKIIEQLPLTHFAEDGVHQDCIIELNYTCEKSKKVEVHVARMVAYIDPCTKNRLVFISNLFGVSPLTICLLYKNRWVIEPLFKQIKQNFELNHFLSDSEEGIKTQIWMAMIMNLIFTVIHKMTKEALEFNTMVRLASNNSAVYVDFISFVRKTDTNTKDENSDLEKVQLEIIFQKERPPF